MTRNAPSSLFKVHCAVVLILLHAASLAGALTLEAHESGSGRLTVNHWETDWGSYDHDYHAGKRLVITLRDVSRRESSADVDVYFIGMPLPAGDRFIYAHHRQAVQFNGRIDVVGEIDAPRLKSHVLNLAALGQRHSSGAEIDGWIVVGSLRGRVFQVRASKQTLLEIAEEHSRQTDSLKRMIAAYQPPRAKGTTPPKSQVAKTRPPTTKPPPPPALVKPSAPVPRQYLILRKPCEIKLPYGSTVLAAGTRLEVLDQRPDVVKVRYADVEPIIPISVTDLAP